MSVYGFTIDRAAEKISEALTNAARIEAEGRVRAALIEANSAARVAGQTMPYNRDEIRRGAV